MTEPLAAWPKWREALVLALRLKDIPGDRIGDILLEVDTHVRESGESPEEAFGNARTYAAERAATLESTDDEGDDGRTLSTIALAFAGSALYTAGAMAIGAGDDAFFGLNAWIALVLGAAILFAGLWRLQVEHIRHPETGAPLLRDTRFGKPILAAIVLALGLGLYGLGRLVAG